MPNGFTQYQAAGILGNWWVESHLKLPAAVEPNGIGHGLGQWSFVRWTNLSNYAAQKGQPWSSLNLQLEFFIYEWYQYYSKTFTGNESSASRGSESFSTGSGKGARLTARSVSGRPKSFIRDLQVNDERSCRENKYITGNNLYFKKGQPAVGKI